MICYGPGSRSPGASRRAGDRRAVIAGSTRVRLPADPSAKASPGPRRPTLTTIADCAVLAEDVYSQTSNSLAAGRGWRRIDAQCWGEGFAAGLYVKGGEVVLAYRGTDDQADAVADARMVPVLEPGAADRTIRAILERYDANRGMLTLAPALMETIFRSRLVRGAVQMLANRIPPGQTRLALDYFDRAPTTPSVVTGHSLGGALAKILGQRRNVRTIAFNSPVMGGLMGIVPQSSRLITSVNTKGDPLSLATAQAGGVPLGEVIEVQIPEFTAPPRFERREIGWEILLSPIAYLIGREVEAHTDYTQKLVQHIAKAALHYHSMENLRKVVVQQLRFRRPLR
ncbi:MAG: hypothetical protein IPM29_06135 [Planctomycetes bacterium]|nr:hypothetical protein [Planctomycetota bacterium]